MWSNTANNKLQEVYTLHKSCMVNRFVLVQALALGANAVLVGRPIVYGLALGGQEGVERVLGILKREFKTSLALMGCPSVHHLNKDVVLQHGDTYSRL